MPLDDLGDGLQLPTAADDEVLENRAVCQCGDVLELDAVADHHRCKSVAALDVSYA